MARTAMTRLAGWALAGVLLLGLAGCNTVKGFGRDLEVLGEKLQGKGGGSEPAPASTAPPAATPAQPAEPAVEVYPYPSAPPADGTAAPRKKDVTPF